MDSFLVHTYHSRTYILESLFIPLSSVHLINKAHSPNFENPQLKCYSFMDPFILRHCFSAKNLMNDKLRITGTDNLWTIFLY